MPGFFIALEGLDGSGKSTQAALLADWLRGFGRQVILTAEPTRGPVGKLVRDGLAGRRRFGPGAMALLFAADRLDHLAKVIEPTLEQGGVVVSDRYVYSSLAYQSVHNHPDWVALVNSRARRPDLTILLDLPVEDCLKRLAERSTGREIYEQAELLGKVRLNYLDLLAREAAKGQRTAVVDGAGPLEVVRGRVFKAAAAALGLGGGRG